jgi:hypothetical protein
MILAATCTGRLGMRNNLLMVEEEGRGKEHDNDDNDDTL